MVALNDELEKLIPVDPLEGSSIECFRYMGSHWIDTLQNMELKLSTTSDFNDVFDGRGSCINKLKNELIKEHITRVLATNIQDATQSVFDEIAKRLDIVDNVNTYSQGFRDAFVERRISDEWRVACFAKPKDMNADALMWSHYANHWKGVRLGFRLLYDLHREIDFRMMTTPYVLDYVRYTDERPVLDLSKVTSLEGDAVMTAYGHRTMVTKSTAWSYESEWRLLVDAPIAPVRYIDNKPISFWRFHPQLLRSIDMGPAMSERDRDALVAFVTQASSCYRHVDINQVVLSESSYTFEYKNIVRGST